MDQVSECRYYELRLKFLHCRKHCKRSRSLLVEGLNAHGGTESGEDVGRTLGLWVLGRWALWCPKKRQRDTDKLVLTRSDKLDFVGSFCSHYRHT